MKKSFIVFIIIAALALSVIAALLIYPSLFPEISEEPPRDNLAYALLDLRDSVVTESGIKLRLSYDKTYYTVTDVSGCGNTHVEIPSSFEGIPVTEIRESAFDKKKDLESLSVPDSVTFISRSSFSKLTMPDLKFNEFAGGHYLGNESNPYRFFIKPEDTYATSLTLHKDTKVIASKAFISNKYFEQVTLPDGLTHINSHAFDGSALREIIIPNGVTDVGEYAFCGCTSLERAVIGKGIKELKNSVFAGCSALESVALPDSVKIVTCSAFTYCTSLKKLSLEKGIEIIIDTAFLPESLEFNEYRDGLYLGNGEEPYLYFIKTKSYTEYSLSLHPDTYSIPVNLSKNAPQTRLLSIEGGVGKYLESKNNCIIRQDNRELIRGTEDAVITDDMKIRSIGNYAFYQCTDLSEIHLPSSVSVIGDAAFYGCFRLKLNSLPASLREIGDMAFHSCSSITELSLPDSVISIGTNAFYNCQGLKSVRLPQGITVIPDYSFTACGSLSEVTMPLAADAIGESAFSGTAIEEIDLSTVRVISMSAFSNCYKLHTVALSDEVGYIGISAFKYCSALEEISLPASLKYLGGGAFDRCSGLRYADLPTSMLYCGSSAFSGCSALDSVTFPEGTTPIAINSFEKCTSLTEIGIPATVTSIELSAFNQCDSLEVIRFGGTLDEWEAVPKLRSLSLTDRSFKLICTDGESDFKLSE